MNSAERTRLTERVRADLAGSSKMSRKDLGDALIALGYANPPEKVAHLKALHARKRAAKILGDLPLDPAEVRLTLSLAARMHEEWALSERSGRRKNGGAQ